MSYVKIRLHSADMDAMRISLSVQTRKLSPEPVCDFCGSKFPVYVYRASRMSTGAVTPCWRWCACTECSALVDANNWKAVEERGARRLMGMLSLPASYFRVAIAATHRALQEFHDYCVRE